MNNADQTNFDQIKYSELLGKYLPQPLGSREDYERSQNLLQRLTGVNEPLTPEKAKFSELLALLIADYERRQNALRSQIISAAKVIGGVRRELGNLKFLGTLEESRTGHTRL